MRGYRNKYIKYKRRRVKNLQKKYRSEGLKVDVKVFNYTFVVPQKLTKKEIFLYLANCSYNLNYFIWKRRKTDQKHGRQNHQTVRILRYVYPKHLILVQIYEKTCSGKSSCTYEKFSAFASSSNRSIQNPLYTVVPLTNRFMT